MLQSNESTNYSNEHLSICGSTNMDKHGAIHYTTKISV